MIKDWNQVPFTLSLLCGTENQVKCKINHKISLPKT